MVSEHFPTTIVEISFNISIALFNPDCSSMEFFQN